MTAFNSPEDQARVVVENALVGEISRVADAIFSLGQRQALSATSPDLALANETASIGKALGNILDSDQNAFDRSTSLRKLQNVIEKASMSYRESHEEAVRRGTRNGDGNTE